MTEEDNLRYYLIKAKEEMDKLTDLLNRIYKKQKPREINFGDDAFYKNVTPLVRDDENTNPNLKGEPTHYKIEFTNGISIVLREDVYGRVSLIIDTLKYYTEKIHNLKNISNEDKEYGKRNTTLIQKSAAPAAGGSVKMRKNKSRKFMKGGKSKKGRKSNKSRRK